MMHSMDQIQVGTESCGASLNLPVIPEFRN